MNKTKRKYELFGNFGVDRSLKKADTGRYPRPKGG
jgi:hypothetical protein